MKIVSEAELAARADLIIAIGGDGTLLYAARLATARRVPLLGINRGRLGFLTDVLPQDVLACVDAALDGGCEVDRRPLLTTSLVTDGATTTTGLALNDIVVQKLATGSMMDFETWIDGRYVNTHAGDGIVIASATGSTAYALSCGGPIVDPHLEVLVIAPICPHTLSDRPIVVSARATIEIRLLERPESRAQVVCDGFVLGDVQPCDRVQVRQSNDERHPAASARIRLLPPAALQAALGPRQHRPLALSSPCSPTCISSISPSSMRWNWTCARDSRCSPEKPAPANPSWWMPCSSSPAAAPGRKWCAMARSARR